MWVAIWLYIYGYIKGRRAMESTRAVERTIWPWLHWGVLTKARRAAAQHWLTAAAGAAMITVIGLEAAEGLLRVKVQEQQHWLLSRWRNLDFQGVHKSADMCYRRTKDLGTFGLHENCNTKACPLLLLLPACHWCQTHRDTKPSRPAMKSFCLQYNFLLEQEDPSQ